MASSIPEVKVTVKTKGAYISLPQPSCVTDISITYLPAAQRNALLLKFTSLYYHNAVVGAETEIQPLQLTTMQLQWTMNAA